MSDSQTHATDTAKDFELLASQPRGLVGELVDYLRHTRKWWLAPVLLMLFLLAALILLGSTGAAPFIYTLF